MSFKENLELIVDQFDDDVYKDPGVFYCSPDHLDAIKHIEKNSFTAATIRNCHVTKLTNTIMLGLFYAMKPEARVEITLFQPIEVMQEYDAKQIEAVAKLAGFDEIRINEADYIDPDSQKQLETLAVSFIKPVTDPKQHFTREVIAEIKTNTRRRNRTKKKTTTE
jgi:hypothetical protein